MADRNLFNDYLKALGVPHTAAYSERRFTAYPHKMALTAVADLRAEYGVMPDELKASDKRDTASLTCPAVVALADGTFGIVYSCNNNNVRVRTRDGKVKSVPQPDFERQWTGAAVWGSAQPGAEEPHLGRHRFTETMATAQKAVFVLGVIFIAAYLYVTNGIYHSWAQTVLLVLYGTGAYVSYLLVLKDNGVHSGAAEKVCGIVEAGGCGTVLEHSSSRLFGLYPWCEIGLTYYTVSFLALLIFPDSARWLAVFSVCCLPYTLWSVGYQKFKIHAWCTLCLTVQTLMWLIFTVMLTGGQFHYLLPVPLWAIVLIVCYITAFLGLHRLINAVNAYEKPEG